MLFKIIQSGTKSIVLLQENILRLLKLLSENWLYSISQSSIPYGKVEYFTLVNWLYRICITLKIVEPIVREPENSLSEISKNLIEFVMEKFPENLLFERFKLVKNRR
eukprot:NODE_28_length_33831_cov_0.361200.p21 type:complete len:107 gc:universal NODE_28_length_33831_cov_0.361200:11894-12214(+)